MTSAAGLFSPIAEMNISAGLGVAIREFPLKTGFADYMLYADAKALGVIEAKPEDHTLTGVELQSAKYTTGLPAGLPHYHLPLPFAYESTGTVTQFTNCPRPGPPQPGSLHLSPARGIDPAGNARKPTAGQPAEHARHSSPRASGTCRSRRSAISTSPWPPTTPGP